MAENLGRMEETINAYEMTIGKYQQSLLVSTPTHKYIYIYIYIYIYNILYTVRILYKR